MLDVSLQKMSISTKSHGKNNSRILNFFCEACAMYVIGKSKVYQRGERKRRKMPKTQILTWRVIPRRRQKKIKLAQPPMKNLIDAHTLNFKRTNFSKGKNI